MSGHRRWRDTDHLERAIETAGGPEIFDDEVQRLRDQARGWRLAELRKRHRMTQAQVASRIGISVSRVSQIEKGDVSTREVLDRYIAALGGTLNLVADFGDEQLKVS
jgi:DNA-binding XRE family transcriptional regulator